MKRYILSIDQGTTGSTVLVIDDEMKIIGRGYKEFPQIYPKPGWVEHNPKDIWLATITAIKAALSNAKLPAKKIDAIGITNQRETTVLWERQTGTPLHNAIVWQCRRTADMCAKLKKAGKEPEIQKRTGLLLDPYFSATKLRWLVENAKNAHKHIEREEAAFGTIDSYLLWQLTGGQMHSTDVTNASRTMLFNINKLEWDDYLLKLFDIPATVLPSVQASSGLFGVTSDSLQKVLPPGIPITGIAGDQQAALFGQGCFGEGEAKCTYGTGAFMLMNTGAKPALSKNRLLTTVAWKIGDKTEYALEGSAFIAGAAVQWLRDELKLIKTAPDSEKLALTVPDNGGVTFVPALAGLGAPHWRSEARGALTGISRGVNAGHIARAVLEGIALQNADIFEAMQKDGKKKLKLLKVDGGASSNNLLMQYQADILNINIMRPQALETTALGAAALAALGAGIIGSKNELRKKLEARLTSFTPKMKPEERKRILANWAIAVKKA